MKGSPYGRWRLGIRRVAWIARFGDPQAVGLERLLGAAAHVVRMPNGVTRGCTPTRFLPTLGGPATCLGPRIEIAIPRNASPYSVSPTTKNSQIIDAIVVPIPDVHDLHAGVADRGLP
jgi:hypothetical protein